MIDIRNQAGQLLGWLRAPAEALDHSTVNIPTERLGQWNLPIKQCVVNGKIMRAIIATQEDMERLEKMPAFKAAELP